MPASSPASSARPGPASLGDKDFVGAWQALVSEWNAAQAKLEALRHDPHCDAAVIEAASAGVAELKARIDALIAEARSGRTPVRDELILGILTRNSS